jgi:hypothetical protein
MPMTPFMPPALYRLIFELAAKHKIATKEVEITIVRKILEEDFDLLCDHSVIGTSKTTGKPFCKECWTRMEIVKAPTIQMSKNKKVIVPGEYRPLSTFLDWERRTKIEAEQGAALKKIEEARQLQEEQEAEEQKQEKQQTPQQKINNPTADDNSGGVKV